jgi:hypothetical protein
MKTSIFGSVVAVLFKIVFRVEMHQNDVFFFLFLKLFLRSVHQNDPKHIKKLNFNKKKLNFLKRNAS